MVKTKNEVKRLYRSTTDTVLAGVAGGIGEYFEIDPIVIRLLFLCSVFFGGFGIPIYLVLWIILPKKQSGESATEDTIKQNVAEMRQKVASISENFKTIPRGNGSKNTVALILILLGALLFLNKLSFIHLDVLGPLLLIIVGFFLFTR